MLRRTSSQGQGGPATHRRPLPTQVSNVTNSSDFASKDSRVFVGNLNTFVLNKEDVDTIFGRFGIITGISMHKGYAFVQYNHPGEARRAVAFENGRLYAGQALDLNIVSEPKIKGQQKRSAPPIRNDRCHLPPADTDFPPAAKQPRQDLNPPMQRSNLVTLATTSRLPVPTRPRAPRPITSSAVSKLAAAAVKRATATVNKSSIGTGRSSASGTTVALPTSDVLICGVCKLHFTSLHSLAQHKKIPCRLRASCQCQSNPPTVPEDSEPTYLDCATCEAGFTSAWALCLHCHDVHNASIFRTEDSRQSEAQPANSDSSIQHSSSSTNGDSCRM